MLPSKGLCRRHGLPKGLARIAPSRNFASKPSHSYTNSIPLRPGASLCSQRPTWQSLHRNGLAQAPSARPLQARFLSSSTSAETGPYNTPLPPADTFAPSTPLHELSDSVRDPLLNTAGDTQWYSGYLKELGIDFGWGSSTAVQYLFEHLHMVDGLSIGGSILTTAIIIRLLTFPLVISASHNGAKISALREVMDPIQKRLTESRLKQDQMALQLAQQDLRKVYTTADINLWKSFLPMLQIPIGFSFWRLTRNMADVPVPGMEVGGFLWFPDLIYPDPYFLLPLATGLLQHLTIRLGGEAGMSATSDKLRAAMMYGLPVLAIVFTSFAPAAVQISFAAAAGLSLCSTTLLRQPAFRAWLKLAPRIKNVPKPTTPETPYKGTINVAGRVRGQTSSPSSTSGGNLRQGSASGASTNTSGATRRFSLTNTLNNVRKSVTDSVGDVMPSAQATADKRIKRKADAHEEKRRNEIEKARWRWEDAQNATRESRRRR